MVGFEPKRFVKKVIPQELLCKACGCVLKKPMQCRTCKIQVCKPCLDDSPQTLCGDDKNVFVECNKFLSNKIAELHLRCKNAAHGCAFIAQVLNIDKHESSCQYAPKQIESSPLKSKKENDKVAEGGKKKKCENGCGKDIDSNEAEVHDCVQYLLGLIKNEREEKKRIDEQISLADTDLAKVNSSYSSYKEQSDKIIEELKEKLINGESDNENLRKEHIDALKNICTTSNFKLKIFKENSEKRKDLTEFQQKLTTEFDQYNEKAKKEFVNYEIKAKADFNGIAPQGLSRSKSPNSTSSKKSFASLSERPGSSLLSPKKSTTTQSKKASVISSPYSPDDGKRI